MESPWIFRSQACEIARLATQRVERAMVNKDGAPRTGGSQGYLRIATEEAFVTPSILKGYLRLLSEPGFDDPGFRSLWGLYGTNSSPRATFINDRLQNLGAQRI